MTPLELLEKVVQTFDNNNARYAVGGGLAASFYRARPRLTNDVDICLLANPEQRSQTYAIELVEKLGLTAFHGWIASSGKLADSTPLVIGRESEDDRGTSLDILLPTLPWLRSAVIRAQENLIDFGFATVPTLTPEDLIIAKQFALSLEPNRFQDRDDIASILSHENDLDRDYLSAELARLHLPDPNG